jgi:pyruvate kinase
MVARGDLGVEIEIEKTPLAQKRIIRTCSRLGVPVIVATQMLESMHESRLPTRAEVSDVANAILDGADACMLSGETAIGRYPVETVRMMRRIQKEAETLLADQPSREFESPRADDGVTEAIVSGAALVARRSEAKLVVIATSSPNAVILKSKQRDYIPTIGITDRPAVVYAMCLLWGVSPVLARNLELSAIKSWIREWSQQTGTLRGGDRVVLVADTEIQPGLLDTLLVWSLPPVHEGDTGAKSQTGTEINSKTKSNMDRRLDRND